MLVYQRVFPIWHMEVSQIMGLSPIASSILIGVSHGNKPSSDLLGYSHDLGNLHLFNGNFRILKWRYCTIFQAIFCWDIPLHKPYISLIYGRYLQSIGSWVMAIDILDLDRPCHIQVQAPPPRYPPVPATRRPWPSTKPCGPHRTTCRRKDRNGRTPLDRNGGCT